MTKTFAEALASGKNNLDFIRFAAAVTVILSHSFELTGHGDAEPLLIFTSQRLSLGRFAVIVFFLVSGFLITRSYTNSRSLRSYLSARMLRIYPGLFFAVMGCIVVFGLLFSELPLKAYFTDKTTVRYALNTLALKISYHLPTTMLSKPFPGNVVNGSLWTLPYELFCYLAIAAVGLLTRRRFLHVLGLIPLLVLLAVLNDRDAVLKSVYYFLCGGLLFLARHRIRSSSLLATACFLLVTAALYFIESEWGMLLLLAPPLAYLVFFLAFLDNTSVSQFGRWGDYSYGLYIWAFPVQQLVSVFFPGPVFLHFLESVSITGCLAFLSWHLVEKRALRLKKRVAGAPASYSAIPSATR